MPLSNEQKAQLVSLYDEAEQAGDTESMTRVRELLAEDARTPAPTNPQDINAAIQEPFTQAIPTLQAAGEGIAEGVKRLGAGIAQSAASTRDFFGQLLKGQTYYDPQIQTYIPESQRRQVVEQEQARQQQSRQSSVFQEPILAGTREAAADITEQSPGLVAGSVGPLSRAETLTGALVKNAALTAGQSAVQFDGDDSYTDEMMAAGIGGGFAALTAAPTAAANMARRAVARGLDNPRTGAALANAQAALGEFPTSLAQRTGVPLVRTIERAAYNSDLQEFYASQADDMTARVASRLNAQAFAPGQLADTFNNARAIARNQVRSLQELRQNAWNNGLTRVQAMGGNELFPTPELGQMIQEIRRSATNPLINLKRDKLPGRVINSLQIVERQGVMSVGQTAALLQGLTTLSKDSDETVRGMARSLRNALDQDMNTAAQNAAQNVPNPLVPSGSTQGPGRSLRELLSVRQQYADDSANILRLKNAVTYQMLGADLKTGKFPPPEDMLKNFSDLKPSQQVSVRDWMSQNTPDTLRIMRQQLANDAVQRAQNITPAARSGADLERLEANLFDPSNGSIPRNLHLFDPQEQRVLFGLRDALRVLKNQGQEGLTAGTPILPADVAINVVSRNSEFVSRFLARALTGAEGYRVLTDPNLYTRILRLGNTRGAGQDAARVALTSYIQDEYGVDPNADNSQP